MTREKEIKTRPEKAQTNAPGYSVPMMDSDIEYLLARNKELQRRIERLESGIQSALEYWNRSETDGAMVDALFTIEERLEKSLDAADAEER